MVPTDRHELNYPEDSICAHVSFDQVGMLVGFCMGCHASLSMYWLEPEALLILDQVMEEGLVILPTTASILLNRQQHCSSSSSSSTLNTMVCA